MAKVTNINRSVPTPPPINSLTLQLTGEEAKTLFDILCRIGGDPKKSRRKYAQSILDAIEKETDWQTGLDKNDMDKTNRSIYFNDSEEN